MILILFLSQAKLNLGLSVFEFSKVTLKKVSDLLEYLKDVAGIRHKYIRDLLSKYGLFIV